MVVGNYIWEKLRLASERLGVEGEGDWLLIYI